MATNITWTNVGDGKYRLVATGWWADVEYKWDRATGQWLVAILDTNAYGVIPLDEVAIAANQAISGGEVPADKLVWADTHKPVIGGRS